MRIFVIGAGNVAYSLVPALQKAGHQVVGIGGRGGHSTLQMASLYHVEPYVVQGQLTLENVDACLVCTADKAIEEVSQWLHPDTTVIHTSGSTGIDVLMRRFRNCGVMYPVQTFSKGVLVDMGSVPLLVEGSNPAAQDLVWTLASSVSANTKIMTSSQRKCLHLSAVFACNFANHMIAASKLLMSDSGVDPSLLDPLVEETIRKAMHNDPIACQSGPARRKDLAILNFHEEMLENYPHLKKIYRFVSESIIDFDDRYKDGLPTKTK